MNRKHRKSAVSDKQTKNTEKAYKQKERNLLEFVSNHQNKYINKAHTKPWYLNES